MRILARQLTTYLSRGRGYPQNKLITTRRFSSFAPKDEIALEAEVERKVGWMLKAFYVASATFVGYQFFPYMGDNLLHQSISLMHVKDPLFKRMGASRISHFAVDGNGVRPCSPCGLMLLVTPIKKEVVLDLARLVTYCCYFPPLKGEYVELDVARPLRFWIILSCSSLVCIAGHPENERRMRVVEMGGDKDLVEMLKFAKDDKTRKSALKALSALSNSDEAAGALHQAGAISVIKSTPVSLEDAALNTYKIKLLQRFQDLKYNEAQPDLS
ncbi:hypothetical protein C5167_014671 [Papaver somniferum]|uniref:Armadillo repeat-containing domain-containing protein n=1 Tax=Papaver somniferum TaxID=3469 RepID=A0A4Y7J7T3_PAPSO|nr:hypothetical protein C5167_014671 [Papaver somniferum]